MIICIAMILWLWKFIKQFWIAINGLKKLSLFTTIKRDATCKKLVRCFCQLVSNLFCSFSFASKIFG